MSPVGLGSGVGLDGVGMLGSAAAVDLLTLGRVGRLVGRCWIPVGGGGCCSSCLHLGRERRRNIEIYIVIPILRYYIVSEIFEAGKRALL